MPGWFQSAGSSDSPADDHQQDPAAESARRFREELSDHLKARAELLALEAGEAGENNSPQIGCCAPEKTNF